MRVGLRPLRRGCTIAGENGSKSAREPVAKPVRFPCAEAIAKRMGL
jgi:hypothetical protein